MGSQNKPRNSPKKRHLTKPRETKAPKTLSPTDPTLQDVGAELRSVVKRLKLVESYLIVCHLALVGQDVEQDNEVAKLLKRGVGDLLFKQIRALENISAKCDGGLPSDREDDDEFEHDDAEGDE